MRILFSVALIFISTMHANSASINVSAPACNYVDDLETVIATIQQNDERARREAVSRFFVNRECIFIEAGQRVELITKYYSPRINSLLVEVRQEGSISKLWVLRAHITTD